MSFSKIDLDSFHTRHVSSTHVAIRFLIKVAEKWWLSIIFYGTRPRRRTQSTIPHRLNAILKKPSLFHHLCLVRKSTILGHGLGHTMLTQTLRTLTTNVRCGCTQFAFQDTVVLVSWQPMWFKQEVGFQKNTRGFCSVPSSDI